ncbi:MAG TPA: DUF6132 family protein [bacterium]|nr:DUF6132 family protein [bacterium]HPR87176.1 DUF6132 family protein [bacterium]
MNKKTIRIGLGLLLGGAAGFAWYYFIGCRTGSCPISGNPWISSSYGALIGLMMAIPSRAAKKSRTESS